MITLGVKPQAIDLLVFLGEDSLGSRSEASIAWVTNPIIDFREFVRSNRTVGRPRDLAMLAPNGRSLGFHSRLVDVAR
jgi:hypothetical protein